MAQQSTYEDDERKNWMWPAVAIGVVYLLAVFAWNGLGEPGAAQSLLGRAFEVLSRGAVKTPTFHYTLCGVLIGAPAAFVSDTVLGTIRTALPGIAVLLAPCLALILLDMFSGDYAGANSFQRVGLGVALVVAILTLTIWLGLTALLGCASASAALHLAAARFDPDHKFWLADREIHNLPRDPGLDVRVGIAIIGITLLLTLYGPLSALFSKETYMTDLELVTSELSAVPMRNPAPPSAKAVQRRIEEFQRELDKTADEACDRARRSWLKTVLNTYFTQMPRQSGWRPGAPVLEMTEGVRAIAEQALQHGYVTWDEFSPYVRIHFDEAAYAQVSRDARARLLAQASCQNYVPKPKLSYDDVVKKLESSR